MKRAPYAAACVISAPRSGATLLECLIAIGILCILFALVAPAVQQARAAARRTLCSGKLHQLGVAMESFHATNGRYPAGGVLAARSKGRSISKNAAPHVHLLPYLDQKPLYDEFNWEELGAGQDGEPPSSTFNAKLINTSIPVFECPSDSSIGPRNNYRISCGTSPGYFEFGRGTENQALRGFRSLFGRDDNNFVDGKSHTAAFSERVVGDQVPATYTAWRDVLDIPATNVRTPDEALVVCRGAVVEPIKHRSFAGATWVLGGYMQSFYNHVVGPNSPIPDCNPEGGSIAARSLHVGGVNALFVDGAVHFIGSDIDIRAWRAIGTVDGAERASNSF